MPPAGDEGPAGSKPFRRELWILPGEDGGSPSEKPIILKKGIFGIRNCKKKKSDSVIHIPKAL